VGGLIELDYGSNGQSITCTINSLASAGARASTFVDNSTNLFEDALVEVTIVTGSTGTSASGYVNVYALGSVDGGTTYGEGATGTDAGITLTVPPNARLVGTINTVANTTTYKSAPMSIAQAFGGFLPQKWVLVVSNQSGHALAASGNSAQYQGVQHQYT
jgi:hypothetical protein